MKRQPIWDKYEVALLISAYIQIKNGEKEKTAELQKLSDNLRRKAESEGLAIDEKFRNLNGMQWQLGYIECAFNNKSFGTRSPSKIFLKMVDMYQNKRESFNEILQIAEVKITGEESSCKVKETRDL